MKRRMSICFLLMITFSLVGCKEKKESTILIGDQKGYYYDVNKEWTEDEYKVKYGMELKKFSAPIMSPYLYKYKLKDKESNIDEIALNLGRIMMEDLSKEYEGKSFTITEYQNLEASVMNQRELERWQERLDYRVHLAENQWLCTFQCQYKYTGTYADIGEMPEDMEWKEGLDMDGGGENYVFIIQQLNEKEYGMRALPKTYYEIVQ